MSRRTDIYAELNALWPDPMPSMTDGEAVRAACKLYRFALRQTFVGTVKIASGNRLSYLKRDQSLWNDGVLIVNPDRGWRDFVHILSHSFFSRKHPGLRPHSKEHGRFELRLVKQVIKRHWLDGRLRDVPKPSVTTNDKRLNRLARIDISIMQWDRKVNRAEAALKKLHSQRRSVVRAIENAKPEDDSPKPPRKPRVSTKLAIGNRQWMDKELHAKATGLGITIEAEDGHFLVYPPSQLEDIDPHEGDHVCDDITGVHTLVHAYIKLLEEQLHHKRIEEEQTQVTHAETQAAAG